MFWKKETPRKATVETCAHDLFQALADGLKRGGRIRAEDIITASASIAAEVCIEAAGGLQPS
jgi:hypothetical protein